MSAAFRMESPSEAELDLLWQLGCQGVLEQGSHVTAYFPEILELPLKGNWEAADTTDYVARYFESLEPIYLSTLVIAPTHRKTTLKAGQKALWLDPGLAFGSGHHETTRMALEALEGLELLGKTVLDVGAGSGILAIAAALLGAQARGVDNDPLTLSVAEANARLNHVSPNFHLGTLTAEVEENVDVLVANLFAELHIDLAAHYAAHLKPGGSLIVTGILKEKAEDVKRALETPFEHVNTATDGAWALLAASRKLA